MSFNFVTFSTIMFVNIFKYLLCFVLSPFLWLSNYMLSLFTMHMSLELFSAFFIFYFLFFTFNLGGFFADLYSTLSSLQLHLDVSNSLRPHGLFSSI